MLLMNIYIIIYIMYFEIYWSVLACMWWSDGGETQASWLWPCWSQGKSSLPSRMLRSCMALFLPMYVHGRGKITLSNYANFEELMNFNFLVLPGKMTRTKNWDFQVEITRLTSNLVGLNWLGSLYTIASRCIDLASILTFHPLLILNPTAAIYNTH